MDGIGEERRHPGAHQHDRGLGLLEGAQGLWNGIGAHDLRLKGPPARGVLPSLCGEGVEEQDARTPLRHGAACGPHLTPRAPAALRS
jgi:hypothetical protein